MQYAMKEPYHCADGACETWHCCKKRTAPNNELHYLVASLPSQGEAFYLWLLLKNGHKPHGIALPSKLTGPDGVDFLSYRDAAYAFNLVDSEDEDSDNDADSDASAACTASAGDDSDESEMISDDDSE